MGAYLFIGFSVLTVGGAATILLSHGAKGLAAGWLTCLISLTALTLFHPGPPWIAAVILAALGVAVPYRLARLSSPAEAFVPGPVRRVLAVGAVWVVSLMILRASHRSPHLIADAGGSVAAPHLYWSLYTTAALFGLGLITLILKRGAAEAWSGAALLLLSPVPAALAATARQGEAEGMPLTLLCLFTLAVHAGLAFVAFRHVRKVSGGLDTESWEELQG